MIDFVEAVKAIEYDFTGLGVSSTGEYNDKNYGQINFVWSANQSKIRISWNSSCSNCICIKRQIHSCNCSWISFQESKWRDKIFTKNQYQKIKSE